MSFQGQGTMDPALLLRGGLGVKTSPQGCPDSLCHLCGGVEQPWEPREMCGPLWETLLLVGQATRETPQGQQGLGSDGGRVSSRGLWCGLFRFQNVGESGLGSCL